MLVSLLVIGVVALAVSSITLMTGFGLGTLLLPVFALFFPLAVAIAATAVVHAANNLFKLTLLRSSIDRRTVVRFGLPAVAAAFGGAYALTRISTLDPLWVWQLGARDAVVTPIKLVMGVLILIFALFDLVPTLRRIHIDPRWLPIGGLASGFFGGLSGHQGALRAVFLGRLKLEPAVFAATQAAIACLVDGARLLVYGRVFLWGSGRGIQSGEEWLIVGATVLFAFAGAVVGKRLLPRVTIGAVHTLTGVLLFVVAVGLGSGVI